LEKLQILAGRTEVSDAAHAIAQLRHLTGTLPLENINVAPHAEEICKLSGEEEPWHDLSEEHVTHLSQVIAPLLRFSISGSYVELQFENQTEQLALAHLRTDKGEIETLRQRICENLALLPTNIPEIAKHLEALTSAQTNPFWENLSCARIMHLQETFAPLMRFRNRRPPSTFVRLSLPDQIQQRHWIVFGPSGEGAFAETYRGRVEALVKDLAGDNPALQRLKRGEELDADDLEAVAAALNGPDLFVTEEQLRKAYDQPTATLADFLRHILEVSALPSRETIISEAFDEWVRQHPQLTATQLMFVRTLRKAVMQKAKISTLDALREPPFNAIGDPEGLFEKSELDDLLELTRSVAA
jgi:type I restriction enzyme R subunit